MRRTQAPSQCYQKKNVTAEGSKLFPETSRSTSQLLNLLSSNSSETLVNVKPEESSTLQVETNHPPRTVDDHSSIKKQYNVVWGKQTKKKHKTWEGDGILTVENENAILKDLDGLILGRSSKLNIQNLEEGSRFLVGSKEVEIIDIISANNVVPVSTNLLPKPAEDTTKTKTSNDSSHFVNPPKRLKRSFTNFASPFNSSNVECLTMPKPDHTHQWKYNKKQLPVTDVRLDHFLSKSLRPHQKEGVLFLYSCVSGIRDAEYLGAILADEMGLGKTLQCIALVWMLLKNGPYGSVPLVQRVLIVTPSSLVSNWLKEFKQWLTFQRLQPFIINQKQKPSDYARLTATSHPVMIISYEMLMRCHDDVKSINFQLLICDEGHRLKNNQNRISMLLSQLEIERKILLSGTPVQNNLQEFFALIDFVNPGTVGTYTEFRKYFELPIVASNQPQCCEESKKLGEARSQELNHRTNAFILRRTQSIIDQYLPSKQECVVFCIPTDFQCELYKAVVSYWEDGLQDDTTKVLPLNVIMMLKKICNHPKLMKKENPSNENSSISNSIFEQMLENFSQPEFENLQNTTNYDLEHSGKMLVLDKLLSELKNINERIVLISYFTQTLDLFETLCNQKQYSFLRLDGNTSVAARNEVVEKFNSPSSKYFVFLLSAKAGGVGLNLIGASRLVLFDLDWNPASDLQAMSRIWRDGQKRNVYIYRFLTTGSIEEKIYQRQISKTFLSNAVIDADQSDGSVRLSIEELKDLFNFRPDCDSLTHEMLMCDCAGDGVPDISIIDENDDHEDDSRLSVLHHKKSKNVSKISELTEWDHFCNPVAESVLEELCLKAAEKQISFIFRNKYAESSKVQK